MSAPEPVFGDPWHAQVFALAVHLNEQGHFTWPDWAQAFGAELALRGLDRELDGGDDYFNAWLTVLEKICSQKGLAEAQALAQMKHAWERAYLATPHGHPVSVKGSGARPSSSC